MPPKSNISLVHTGMAGRPKQARPRFYLPLPHDFPPPPDMTPDALALWQHYIPMLAERGDVSQTDLAALEMFCRLYANWRKNRTIIEQNGDLIKNDKGRPVSHPLRYAVYGDEVQLMKLFAQLRLVPSARADVADTSSNGPAISVDF